jgi:hypothetical protein
MALIFSRNGSNVGVVEGYRNQSANIILISIADADFSSTITAATTTVNLDLNTKFQINESLNQDIYMLVFGEQVRSIKLGLLVFEDACDIPNKKKGIGAILEWWDNNNLFNRSSSVNVTIGGNTTKAYISNLSANMQDPEERIWIVSIGLLGVPARGLANLTSTQPTPNLQAPVSLPGATPAPLPPINGVVGGAGAPSLPVTNRPSPGPSYNGLGDPLNTGPFIIPLEGGYPRI